MKLFCLTYAGGTAAFYDELKELLKPDGIEIIALEYSGHGARHNETFYYDFRDLGQDMITNMRIYLRKDEPYALMGYSMGAISALEIIRMLSDKKEKTDLIHVFLAAHAPKTKKSPISLMDTDADEVIRQRVINFGGVPDKLINNRAFWRTYLPIYKADFDLIQKYKFEEVNFTTGIPATVFYSDTDTPYEEMMLWNNYFVGSIRYHRFEGDHFFIKQHEHEIADNIKNNLKT